MAVPDISTGYTISGATANSGWTPKIVDVTPPGESVDVIDDSTQATTGTRTKRAADLNEPDEVVLEIQYDNADKPVVGAANEAWTLTLPDASTDTFQGFVSGFDPATHILNGLMMASATIQVSGAVS